MNTRIDRETAAQIVLDLFGDPDSGEYALGLDTTEKESTIHDICKLFGARWDDNRRHYAFPDHSAVAIDQCAGTFCHSMVYPAAG